MNHYVVPVQDYAARPGHVPIPANSHTSVGQAAVHEVQCAVVGVGGAPVTRPATSASRIATIIIYIMVFTTYGIVEKVAIPPPKHYSIDHHTDANSCGKEGDVRISEPSPKKQDKTSKRVVQVKAVIYT